MPPELDGLFDAYAQTAYPYPRVLSESGIADRKRAYMAGALAVLASLPRNELVHTRAEIDRLTLQAQAYLQNVPMPAAVAQDAPAIPPAAPPAPAVAPAPAATSDSPNSDLPLSDGPQLE